MKALFARRRLDRPMWRWLPSLLVMLVIAYVARHVHGAVLFAANTWDVVDWLMQESLDVLVNKIAIGAHFNTDVQKEFDHDFAPGETVRVPYPVEFLIRTGLDYSAQPINMRHTTVSCTDIFGIDFEWNSFEEALDLSRDKAYLKRNFVDSPMAQLAQEIETRAGTWAKNYTSTLVGTLGTDPTDFYGSSSAARQKMVELACPPDGDHGIFVTPSLMRELKKTNSTAFNPQVDVSKMIRTGVVGYGDNFDWYESVSVVAHTAGTWAAAVTVTSQPADGSTSVTITATAGDTFKLGDKFSFASVYPTNPRTRLKVSSSAKTFTVTQDLTAAGGGADVLNFWPPVYGPGNVYQNVTALPAAAAALTLWPGTTAPNGKSGTVNLALHRNAFALVNVEFSNPKEGGNVRIARQLRDEDTGITIAFLRMFDGYYRKWITRFDVCMGFGNLYSDQCAVAIAGA